MMMNLVVSPARCLFYLPIIGLLGVWVLTDSALSYKPVVLIHGLFQDNTTKENLTMDAVKQLIIKAHPGTKVTIPELYVGSDSLTPLWDQIPDFRKALEDVMSSAKDGIHLLCYSQGGILCRALLANMSDHNVNTFISLSSPQMGQFGDTSAIPFLPKAKEEVYRACYTKDGQKMFSVCNYWNDPHQRPDYLKENVFLPVLNNETYCNNSQVWRKNMLKLKRMVLIGGADDGVIEPWQSSHFGFYNDKEEIVEMRNQEVFIKDSFGLQTLYKRGRMKTFSISGVKHLHWPTNQTIFDCCIEPYLT